MNMYNIKQCPNPFEELHKLTDNKVFFRLVNLRVSGVKNGVVQYEEQARLTIGVAGKELATFIETDIETAIHTAFDYCVDCKLIVL